MSVLGAEVGSVETENMGVIFVIPRDMCVKPKMQTGLQSEIIYKVINPCGLEVSEAPESGECGRKGRNRHMCVSIHTHTSGMDSSDIQKSSSVHKIVLVTY